MERYAGAVPYAYTSANSQTSRTHWDKFAEEVSQHVGLHVADYIIEIGSNDGYLCEQFNKHGYYATGIEASPEMAALAEARGVPTFNTLWHGNLGRDLRDLTSGHPKLVIANNVFNHANDPIDFLTGVAAALAPDGMFVCEVPAWEELIENLAFDQVYHEHVTYWSLASLLRACNRAGLAVTSYELVDYHGGSWRIYARRGDGGLHGVQGIGEYGPFRQQVQQQRKNFLTIFASVFEGHRPVVCIGAAAKANTFLTYYGLDHTIIDWVTDNSPQKIGKYTPGTRIPIRPDSSLVGVDRPYAIVTAWNLIDQLRPALRQINPTIEFLNPREAV